MMIQYRYNRKGCMIFALFASIKWLGYSAAKICHKPYLTITPSFRRYLWKCRSAPWNKNTWYWSIICKHISNKKWLSAKDKCTQSLCQHGNRQWIFRRTFGVNGKFTHLNPKQTPCYSFDFIAFMTCNMQSLRCGIKSGGVLFCPFAR